MECDAYAVFAATCSTRPGRCPRSCGGAVCRYRAGPAAQPSRGSLRPAQTAQTSYLNPAGMTRLEGSNLAVQAIYGQTFASFQTDDRTTTAGGDPAGQRPGTGAQPLLRAAQFSMTTGGSASP